MKSGFVAIIGRPNAGKTTLLNTLLNEKIAITTPKAQTTRNAIQGIINVDDYQIIFIDTPGIHDAKNALGSYMNKEAFSQIEGADIVFYMLDCTNGFNNDDERNLNIIKEHNITTFLILNKIDLVNKEKLIPMLDYINSKFSFDEIVPISALNNTNVDELINTSKKYINDEAQYYPNEVKTNVDINFRISEIIREKVILNTEKEVPHLIACKIENIKELNSKVYIDAIIVCNKDSHKAIIIGKEGKMLKKINEQSKKDISILFDNKKVFLSLFVKVEEDWLNSEKKLFNLGYFTEK